MIAGQKDKIGDDVEIVPTEWGARCALVGTRSTLVPNLSFDVKEVN
jgi:hypothetical protein